MLARAVPTEPAKLSEPPSSRPLDARLPARRRAREGRRRRRPGRYLALLALAAVVVAIVLMVRSQQSATTKPPQPAAVSRPRSHHHFWIVRPNQTLSEIVARTGVSLSQIEALNPKLNPGALQNGQLIRIRR